VVNPAPLTVLEAESVEKEPAAGVVPPMVVALMLPPVMAPELAFWVAMVPSPLTAV
jgi:hypothetical protein